MKQLGSHFGLFAVIYYWVNPMDVFPSYCKC